MSGRVALALTVLGVTLAGVGLAVSCRPSHCTFSTDCATAEFCMYPIGSCQAQGECQSLASGSCDAASVLCGCSGTVVSTGCGFPAGYASGPTEPGVPFAIDPDDASVACTRGDGGFR